MLTDQQLLIVVLLVGGLASGLIVSLAVAAFTRRRSWSYFLVTLALIVIFGRTVLGGLMLGGLIDETSHHVLEHGMDILTIGLLIGAVYVARTVERPPTEDENTS